MSNQLSSLKQKKEEATTVVLVSEKSLTDLKSNVEALESQLKHHEYAKSQIVAASAAIIKSTEGLIQARKAKLAEQQALSKTTQTKFAVQNELFKQGLITQLEFREGEQNLKLASLGVSTAEDDVRSAENDLILRKNEGQAKEQKAQLEINSATVALGNAKAEVTKAEGDLAKATAEMNEIQEEVVELATNLASHRNHQIHAPVSGHITRLCTQELLKQGDAICLLSPAAVAAQGDLDKQD